MRLLVVEDSPLVRKMFRLAFPSQTNDLQSAENGRSAMELLARSGEPFDAVLLDLRMPDMDGVEFLRALRRQPVHRRTPIILTTAESDDSDLLAQARALGVAAVVKKPWVPRGLRSVVREIIESPQGLPCPSRFSA
jgi:two-component system chemotaxis response regulator CheY